MEDDSFTNSSAAAAVIALVITLTVIYQVFGSAGKTKYPPRVLFSEVSKAGELSPKLCKKAISGDHADGNSSCLLPVEEGSHFYGTYFKYVNPRWVDFMKVTGFNVEYVHCLGTELFTVDGQRKLDFICSFSVHNIGHNHPHVVESIVKAVTNGRPAILHCCYVPEIAG
jgi:hypothetical protein